METPAPLNAQRDPALWRIAKARAGFKVHALVYTLVNAGLWLIWAFTSSAEMYPWPMWTTLGWGIGLFFNYLGAYSFSGRNSTFSPEREYNRLMQNRG